MLDLYLVTIFDRTGPARFTKRVLASSKASAEALAARWPGRVEYVEFESEIDAVEGTSGADAT